MILVMGNLNQYAVDRSLKSPRREYMERNSESTLFIQSVIAIAAVVLFGSLSVALSSSIFKAERFSQQPNLAVQTR